MPLCVAPRGKAPRADRKIRVSPREGEVPRATQTRKSRMPTSALWQLTAAAMASASRNRHRRSFHPGPIPAHESVVLEASESGADRAALRGCQSGRAAGLHARAAFFARLSKNGMGNIVFQYY
jgi:hypothetical protein